MLTWIDLGRIECYDGWIREGIIKGKTFFRLYYQVNINKWFLEYRLTDNVEWTVEEVPGLHSGEQIALRKLTN